MNADQEVVATAEAPASVARVVGSLIRDGELPRAAVIARIHKDELGDEASRSELLDIIKARLMGDWSQETVNRACYITEEVLGRSFLGVIMEVNRTKIPVSYMYGWDTVMKEGIIASYEAKRWVPTHIRKAAGDLTFGLKMLKRGKEGDFEEGMARIHMAEVAAARSQDAIATALARSIRGMLRDNGRENTAAKINRVLEEVDTHLRAVRIRGRQKV